MIAQLKKPVNLSVRWPRLMSYYSKTDNKEYIILAPGSDDNKPLYRYDFNTNRWDPFTQYPTGIIATFALAAIDEAHDLLYVFGMIYLKASDVSLP